MPLGTLRRWEQTGKPPRQLAHVVNCAIVLGCEDRLALVEEHWLTWTPLAGASQPPSALPHPAPLPLVAPPRSHRDRETYVRDDDREEFEQFLRGGD